MNDRGQTAQDFAVGISVLILTLAGVFTFMPAVFQPAENPVERGAHNQAMSLADTIVAEYSVGGTANTLEHDRLEDYFDGDGDGEPDSQELSDAAKDDAGIDYRNVNVTITNGNPDGKAYDDAVITTGDSVYLESDVTATVSRIVTFEDSSRCQGGCRLIVRVW